MASSLITDVTVLIYSYSFFLLFYDSLYEERDLGTFQHLHKTFPDVYFYKKNIRKSNQKFLIYPTPSYDDLSLVSIVSTNHDKL